MISLRTQRLITQMEMVAKEEELKEEITQAKESVIAENSAAAGDSSRSPASSCSSSSSDVASSSLPCHYSEDALATCPYLSLMPQKQYPLLTPPHLEELDEHFLSIPHEQRTPDYICKKQVMGRQEEAKD